MNKAMVWMGSPMFPKIIPRNPPKPKAAITGNVRQFQIGKAGVLFDETAGSV